MSLIPGPSHTDTLDGGRPKLLTASVLDDPGIRLNILDFAHLKEKSGDVLDLILTVDKYP